MQNIMVTRFGNTMMEAVWNNRYVDHVQITAAEAVTVGTRGRFYDATGALRDMVPNHLLQLLAMIAMEPPISFDADAIRTEKEKVIAAIRPIDPTEAVRGRYCSGTIAGKAVSAYLDEPDVDPASCTETFAALKLHVETWRWSGVPFYLRTGKALSTRDTEIVVQFRDVPLALSRRRWWTGCPQPSCGANPARRGHQPRVCGQAARAHREHRASGHGFPLP